MTALKLSTIKAGTTDRVILETEFSAICPITKTVDEYVATIEYTPNNDGIYVELKSLKEYLSKFKDVEIFHEDLAATLVRDLVETIKPKYLCVKLRSRFLGIDVTIIKEFKDSSIPATLEQLH